jgi:hypothetical protein
MTLDGLEGDSSAGWDATGFFCCEPWKIQLAHHLYFGPFSVQPTDNRSKPSQLILIHPMDDF